MPDNRFFTRQGPFTTREIAERTGATLQGGDADRRLSDVLPLDQAGPEDLSFLDNMKYRDQFAITKAGACFVTPEAAHLCPASTVALVTPNPYKAYARAAQAFYPPTLPRSVISKRAVLGDGCVIEEGSVVEDNVVIGPGATIGKGCWIEANAVIGPGVVLGDGTRVGPNATISHALIGARVRIYPGCHIGQDGFGFAIDPAGHVKVPQLGRVVIGSDVEIGAGTCIDRGSGPDTVIGAGSWIDNLVQIGHNVQIGRGCVIVSQCGISGSTVIDDYAVLAGQVGVAGHLHIGKGARIGAKSGILSDVPAGAEVMGYPASPIKQFFRQTVELKRLGTRKKARE